MRRATPVRALIVDDEPLSREIIREMLRGDAGVEIIGECRDGLEAVSAIEDLTPDVVFLDVQMPEMDGFAVLEAVGPDHIPSIVFVTAFDQYAVHAFEVHALDYILKPFDPERFKEALQRAKAQVRHANDLSQKLDALLQEVKKKPGYKERLIIKTSGRVLFLKTDEIDWIEAEGNYVRLHVGKESYLYRAGISSLESQLDSKEFLRTHRSIIVNMDRIHEVHALFQGEYCVILRDGKQLPLSRNYWDKLRHLLDRTI